MANKPTNPALYARVKSEAKSKFDTWPCVPVSTSKALTKEGWKSYFELEIGELILAYDINTKTNKWTPVLNLHYYENAPTIDIVKPGHNIKLTSTPDHKWVVYRKATGPDLIIHKNAELVYSLIQKLKEKEITFAEALEYSSSIQEHYKKYKNHTWEQFLKDSKFSKGGEFLITTEELKNGGFQQYAIKNAAPLDESYSDSNLKLTSKYNDSWTKNVLDMSRSQSEVWFSSAIIYDGNQIKDYEKNLNGSRTYKTYGFKQKHPDHQDAFVASCILTGRRVRYGIYSENGCRNFYITERDYIPLDTVYFNDGESTDVWCPETEFGTWVMNQNGLVTITGNSAYGSAWLVGTYKKRGGGYRKAQNGMEVQDSINEFVNDMRMMPMGGGIMYEDYNFPMMNGGEYSYMTYNPENQAPELPEMEQMREGGIPPRYKNMGLNKVGVKKQSTRPGKKWMVLAKKDDKYKVVHGGYKGMKDFTQHRNEDRRDRFWDRMGGRNSAKATDPFSPLYWHKRFGSWAEGGEPQNEGFQALPEAVQSKILSNMAYGGYTNPYLMDGGEPQNAGFQALPQEVQAKIMANMMYGGYLPKAAAGAAIMPIIKAVAPAIIGAMSKNKQASASAPAQAPVNIYNVSPQQSETFQNPYNMKRPGEDVYDYAMGGVPCYECGGQMKYKKGGTPFTAMAYFEDGGYLPKAQTGMPMGSELGEFNFQEATMQAENPMGTEPGLASMEQPALDGLQQAPAGLMNTQMGPMLPGQQLSSDFSKFWETNNPFDKKDIAYMTQNKRGQPMDEDMYRLKKAAPKIMGALVDKGKDYLKDRYADYSTPGKGFKSATNTVGDLVSLGSWFGKRNKENTAKVENSRRSFSDNLFPTMPSGITGERGNFDAFGNFRPDETLASRTYFSEMGGEIEMTDDQIRQLVALGAEIEILD